MEKLLKIARREEKRRDERPNVYKLSGWSSFLYYLYYRNRFFLIRETGMWILNFAELGLAAWLLGGMKVRGFALAFRYVFLIYMIWNGAALAERILVARYYAANKPAKIARTIATFIQTAFVFGIVAATILILLSGKLVGGENIDNATNWALIIFCWRVAVLLIELIGSSYFMGAYTLARMYRPLTLSFSIRFLIIALNILLFPIIGPIALIITLYLRRITALCITIYISRKWVFERFRVPRLPVFKLPKWKKSIILEMIPFSLGRAAGALFAGGFSLIIAQLVNWTLPRQFIYYIMFYQALDLLFMIPKRLSRCVFFDVSNLLIENQIKLLKQYIRKLDKITFISGFVVAALCVCIGFWGEKININKISENFEMFKPMFFATAVFLVFYPANIMWLSVREAAGELKFNNWLLFITNYLIGLPVIAYILTHVTGEIIYVEKSGLQFAVVTHALTFAYVIIADSCLEAVRAFLSRIHIFKFNWIEKSPLRLTRSLLDMEVEVFKGGSFAKGFSEDLTELIDDKFIRAGVEGAVSFSFWTRKALELINSKNDFAVVSLVPDYKISNVWLDGGEGYARLAEVIENKGEICRVSRYYVAVLVPNVSESDCKNTVIQIHSEIGVYLSNCAYAHSSGKKFNSLSDVIKWLSSPKEYYAGFSRNEEWLEIAARIFRLTGLKKDDSENNRQKMSFVLNEEIPLFPPRNSPGFALKKGDCQLMVKQKSVGNSAAQFRDFCKNNLRVIFEKYLLREVNWINLRDRGFSDDDNDVSAEMWRLMNNEEKRTAENGIPDYRKFSRNEWRGYAPVYFRGTLIGFFKFEAENIEEQKEVILICAANYLFYSISSV